MNFVKIRTHETMQRKMCNNAMFCMDLHVWLVSSSNEARYVFRFK